MNPRDRIWHNLIMSDSIARVHLESIRLQCHYIVSHQITLHYTAFYCSALHCGHYIILSIKIERERFSSNYCFHLLYIIILFQHGTTELSTGRMDPRVGSGHDFAGFWRVGSALRIFKLFTDYFFVPESIWIFEYCIRIDWFSTIFSI